MMLGAAVAILLLEWETKTKDPGAEKIEMNYVKTAELITAITCLKPSC